MRCQNFHAIRNDATFCRLRCSLCVCQAVSACNQRTIINYHSTGRENPGRMIAAVDDVQLNEQQALYQCHHCEKHQTQNASLCLCLCVSLYVLFNAGQRHIPVLHAAQLSGTAHRRIGEGGKLNVTQQRQFNSPSQLWHVQYRRSDARRLDGRRPCAPAAQQWRLSFHANQTPSHSHRAHHPVVA